MSWCSGRFTRKFAAALAVGAALALAAGGCGFQPLYKKDAVDPGVTGEFTRIKVMNVVAEEAKYDRLGQQMHNLLRQRLNPDGAPASPQYLLENNLTVSLARTGIQITEEATRARLIVRVSFRLLDAATRQVLYSGSEQSVNSYNVVDSQYATLSAEKDAGQRAVREMSDSIRIRLALYFQRLHES
jgi:LPS-assembly lipoprotein